MSTFTAKTYEICKNIHVQIGGLILWLHTMYLRISEIKHYFFVYSQNNITQWNIIIYRLQINNV